VTLDDGGVMSQGVALLPLQRTHQLRGGKRGRQANESCSKTWNGAQN